MPFSSNNNVFIMEANDNALVAPSFSLLVGEPIICPASIGSSKKGKQPVQYEGQQPAQFTFQFNGSSLNTDYANWQQYVFCFRNYGANPTSGPKGYSVAPFVENWRSANPSEICNSTNSQNSDLSKYGFKEYFFDSDSIPAQTLFSINLSTDSSKKIIQATFIISVKESELMNVTIKLANMRTDFKDTSTDKYPFMTIADMSPLHVATLNIVGDNGGLALFTGGAGQILYGNGESGSIKPVETIPSKFRGDTTGETSNIGYAAVTQSNPTSIIAQNFAFIPLSF